MGSIFDNSGINRAGSSSSSSTPSRNYETTGSGELFGGGEYQATRSTSATGAEFHGVIVSDTEPTLRSNRTSLVLGDLWIRTDDTEHRLYVYDASNTWVLTGRASDWATIDNDDTIPAAKIPDLTFGDFHEFDTVAERNTGEDASGDAINWHAGDRALVGTGSSRSLYIYINQTPKTGASVDSDWSNISQVDLSAYLTSSEIENFAKVGDTTDVPVSKIPSEVPQSDADTANMEVPVYNGSTWVNKQVAFGDLDGDIALTQLPEPSDISNRFGLIYNAGTNVWELRQFTYGDLDGSTDISGFTGNLTVSQLPNPSDIEEDDVLIYDGSDWVVRKLDLSDIGGSITTGQLPDTTGASDGDILQVDGDGNWELVPNPGSGSLVAINPTVAPSADEATSISVDGEGYRIPNNVIIADSQPSRSLPVGTIWVDTEDNSEEAHPDTPRIMILTAVSASSNQFTPLPVASTWVKTQYYHRGTLVNFENRLWERLTEGSDSDVGDDTPASLPLRWVDVGSSRDYVSAGNIRHYAHNEVVAFTPTGGTLGYYIVIEDHQVAADATNAQLQAELEAHAVKIVTGDVTTQEVQIFAVSSTTQTEINALNANEGDIVVDTNNYVMYLYDEREDNDLMREGNETELRIID